MPLLLPRAARPLYALDHAHDDSLLAPAVDEAPPPAPAPVPATLDADRQAKARRYARQRHTLALVSLALDAALIAILLFSGLSFALRDALAGAPAWEPLAGWLPARVGLYFLVLFAGAFVLGLPLSYYSGHVLPHRYGLSTQSRRAWALDLLKGLAISLPFELVAVEFVYWLLAAAPDFWWLWTGAAMLFVTVILANLAPILFLPLFYKLTPLPDGEVRSRALALAARTGTRVRGIYSMNMSTKTTAANAMVMGLGNTRRIILGDTLLDRYTPDEIEVVLAHELGHQVHGDIPRLIAVQTAVTLGGLFAVNLLLHTIVARFTAYHGLSDAATMPLVGAALAAFALVTLPLSNGFSRRVEHQADVYALETTRKPDAFISAMTRLANQNLAELEPAWFVEFLLYNHPSIARRLALGRRYAERMGETGQIATTGEPSGASIS
jgi:Zn-dependent protease with chaperone function